MILRRFTASMKRQDWAAVIIELLVVIAGVFIGLQASNWNQELADNKRAVDFSQRLLEDLREEAWGYQLMIDYNQQVLANVERVEGALTGTAPLDDAALLVAAYRGTQYKQKLRRRSTYDELISTGAIGLIRDRKLRDLAMRVYSMPTVDNFVREGMVSRYREAFRASVPIAVQRALAETCGDRLTPTGDYPSLAHALNYACSTGLSETAVRESVAALRNNPELLPSLRQRAADIATRLGDMINNNKDIRKDLMEIAGVMPAS